jgi:uncharacterized protein YoxC
MNEVKIALIILMVIEIFFIYLCCYLIIKIKNARHWIQHKAIITDSNVESFVDHSTDKTATTYYRYKITYKYSIDSIDYTKQLSNNIK